MIFSIKTGIVWGLLILLLEYYGIFVLLLHVALGLMYYEYQFIFQKLCVIQTGKKEETYIPILSSSIVPYILILACLLCCTVPTENPERVLCCCFIASNFTMVFLRIRQYSSFCFEVTDQKRRKNKIQKSKEDD